MPALRPLLLGAAGLVLGCNAATNTPDSGSGDAALPRAPDAVRSTPAPSHGHPGPLEPDADTEPEPEPAPVPLPAAPLDAGRVLQPLDAAGPSKPPASPDAGTRDAGGAPTLDASLDPALHLDAAMVTPADAGSPTSPSDASVAGDASLGDAGDEAPVKRVFATSLVYNAALGGLDGADALCAFHAASAGLEGAYAAWLSTLDVSAAARLSHSVDGLARTDGVLVAQSFEDLLDGDLLAPIDRDEFGNPLTGDVWTGTLSTGASYPSSDCDGFTSAATGAALCGNSTSTGSSWTENVLPSCATPLRLYCVEQ